MLLEINYSPSAAYLLNLLPFLLGAHNELPLPFRSFGLKNALFVSPI